MSIEKSIVSTPIDFPALKPDDWDKWWYIWNKFSEPLIKSRASLNNDVGKHIGFDVYRHNLFNPVHSAKFVNLEVLYPSLYEQIVSLPIKIYGARFLMSAVDFPAHIDNGFKSWSLRSMFHCEDLEPQWYYTDMENNNKQYLSMPAFTNWWAYLDGAVKHGTHYREKYPKIILQVFSSIPSTNSFVEKSIGKFPEYSNYYDIGS